jgi:replicative DNA helicase
MTKNHHLHTERAILASIFKDPGLLVNLDVNGKVSSKAFKSVFHRELITLCVDLYNSGYTRFNEELIFSRAQLLNIPDVDTAQIGVFIRHLFSADVDVTIFSRYVEDLLDTHLRDELVSNLQQSMERILNSEGRKAIDLLSEAQSALYQLDVSIAKNDEPIAVAGALGKIYELLETPMVGIPTGIKLIDENTMGFLNKKFYFVGARPGEGKSAFLTQCTAHAAFFAGNKRVPALYLDTEIDTDEFMIRLVGHIAGVDTLKIMSGEWIKDKSMYENVEDAMALVRESGQIYHKYIPGYTTSSVINTIRRYVYNHGVGIVFMDYLKSPKDVDDRARWERIGEMATSLKDQAGQLDIPIVSALQQNKKGDKVSRVTSDAYAESDDVFKEADGAFALNRKTGEEIKKEGIAAGTHRFQTLKGRYFRSSFTGFNLTFVDYCLRFFPAMVQFSTEVTNAGESTNDHASLPQISTNYARPFKRTD